MSNVRVPKLTVPFNIVGTEANVVEQDSPEEVAQCVEALIRTYIGELVDEPEYGVPDMVFAEGDIDVEALAAVVTEWEPRAAHTITEEYITETARRVRIEINNATEA